HTTLFRSPSSGPSFEGRRAPIASDRTITKCKRPRTRAAASRCPWGPATRAPHPRRSALRELELLTSARLTRLLTLLLTRITREKPRSLQRRLEVLIELDERARDPMAHGLGLRRGAATCHIHLDVKLSGLRHGLEGLRDDHTEHVVREIVLKSATVHRRHAGAGLQENTRNSRLALACTVIAAVDNFGVSHIDLLRWKGAGAFAPRGDGKRLRRT